MRKYLLAAAAVGALLASSGGAFAEAVKLYLRDDAKAKSGMQRLLKKHCKAKAMSIMAHKLARAVYFILLRGEPWNEAKFLKGA